LCSGLRCEIYWELSLSDYKMYDVQYDQYRPLIRTKRFITHLEVLPALRRPLWRRSDWEPHAAEAVLCRAPKDERIFWGVQAAFLDVMWWTVM
jgi:hypothetical protein